MSESLIIPGAEVECELKIVNSIFITNAAPAFSVDEAKAFVKKISAKYNDANHNVPVFIIGHKRNITSHCSDDGEPSGTAGRPALAVLSGSGLGDVVVVVTRYFGGTKLGTGGLVRAYSDSVREVLKKLPLAEKVETYTVLFNITYPLFERSKLVLDKYHVKVIDEDFGADVMLTLQMRTQYFNNLKEDLSELTSGNLQLEIMETNPNTIMPFVKPE